MYIYTHSRACKSRCVCARVCNTDRCGGLEVIIIIVILVVIIYITVIIVMIIVIIIIVTMIVIIMMMIIILTFPSQASQPAPAGAGLERTEGGS